MPEELQNWNKIRIPTVAVTIIAPSTPYDTLYIHVDLITASVTAPQPKRLMILSSSALGSRSQALEKSTYAIYNLSFLDTQ